MAILLTTSYQRIGTISLDYGEIRLYGRYYEQSQANNYTNFQLKTTYYTSQSSLSFSSATTYLDGTRKDYGYTTFSRGETTIMEEVRTEYHNTDGTSPTRNIGATWSATFGGNGSVYVDVTFPKIDRYPMITSAPDFNDEENATVQYSTTSGFTGATYSICIALAGSNHDDISYRDVDLSSGSYTFEFTNAEREVLRNSTPNSNTTTANFILRTRTSGGTYYFSSALRTLSIVNADPTFTHTEVETNSNVISILGSSGASQVIQNASVIDVTISPTALKGATITSVKVNSGSYSETKTTSPYVFTVPVTQQSFGVVIRDSRGNSKTSIFTKSMIAYSPISFNSFSFERENPTSSNIIVDLDSNYYQQTFGSSTNVPIVKWKLDDGTYTTIPSTEYTIDTTNHKLTITSYELTNALVYTSKGTFTLEVSDLLSSFSDTQDVLKGIPTFDYGEHDLKVNGDLFIADIDGENPVNVKNLFGDILYENSTGVNGLVPLSKSLSDYSTIEVFTKDNYGSYINYNSIKAKVDVGNCLTIINATAHTGTQMIMEITRYTMNNDNLTRVYGISPRIATSGASLVQNSDRTKVIKVIGYK